MAMSKKRKPWGAGGKNPDKDKYNLGRWTDEEHRLFLEALRIYGKDWDLMEKHIVTRDAAHCRSHAQKFFQKLKKCVNGSEEAKENEIDNAQLYYEILQRKIDKPIKRKRRKRNPAIKNTENQNEEGEELNDNQEDPEDQDDEVQNQTTLFHVEKDRNAVMNRDAKTNIKPSSFIV